MNERRRITVFIMIVFYVAILAALDGCHSSSDTKKNVAERLDISKEQTKIVIPKTLHPVKGTLQQTSYIGTPDHPTIDGGMINAADGMVINHDGPIEKKNENKKPDIKLKKPIESPSSPLILQTRSFQDDWATSNRVKQVLTRAASDGKLDYVLKKMDEMGLPASVAVVPMIESDYQNQAVSNKGAAGAWQLMPSTAKAYGLNKEDRFQFNRETDAALKLLNDLHQQFGNWDLTFAAYNAGGNRVSRALQKNPDATTVDELDLPTETKMYVKRMKGLNQSIMTLSEES